MTDTRKQCSNCGLLTTKWQRVNDGPFHCFDECVSTTGILPNGIRVPKFMATRISERTNDD